MPCQFVCIAKHLFVSLCLFKVSKPGDEGRVSTLPDSMQYRQMKAGYKTRTYVRNSSIHSLGLFAADNYRAQEMVIEYTGLCIIVVYVLEADVLNILFRQV